MAPVFSCSRALPKRRKPHAERHADLTPARAVPWYAWMTVPRALTLGLLLLTMAFALLRLVHLEADPPQGLTTSHVLYTDEGWYARNAVAWALTDHWHMEGDFNPAVNIPVWTILQAAMFGLFGTSLHTARLLAVAFFFALLVIFYQFAIRYVPTWAALAGCLILATSYRLFAFSRLALLEVPMMTFVMLSLLLAAKAKRGQWRLRVVLSAGAFACAYLTKTTALIGLPAVMYLLWCASDGPWDRLKGLVLWITVLLLFLCTHYAAVALPYHRDYVYFNELNIAERWFDGWQPLAVWQHVSHVAELGLTRFDPLLTFAVVVGALPLLASRRFRRCVAVRVAFLWGGALIALMLTTTHHPPRYFLPMAVPLALLASAALAHLRPPEGGWLLRPIFAILLVSVLAIQGHTVLRYLAQPEYSFVEMCDQVRQQLVAEDRPVLLMGHMADSIGLELGMVCVNDQMGTWPLRDRLDVYQPTHVIGYGQMDASLAGALALRGRQGRLLARYEVYHSYADTRPLRLYVLEDRQADAAEERTATRRSELVAWQLSQRLADWQ